MDFNPCESFKPLREVHSRDAKGKLKYYLTEVDKSSCVIEPEDGDQEVDQWRESTYECIQSEKDTKASCTLVEVKEMVTGISRTSIWTSQSKNRPPVNIPERKADAPLQKKEVKKTELSPEELKAKERTDRIRFMARVIYSEASGQTLEEKQLISTVIWNRRKKEGFGGGRLVRAYDVVRQPWAFSCIGDKSNKQWEASRRPWELKGEALNHWKQAEALAIRLEDRTFTPVNGQVVYYHDDSITMPSNWNNEWFEAYPVETGSKSYSFYGIRRRNVPEINLAERLKTLISDLR